MTAKMYQRGHEIYYDDKKEEYPGKFFFPFPFNNFDNFNPRSLTFSFPNF